MHILQISLPTFSSLKCFTSRYIIKNEVYSSQPMWILFFVKLLYVSVYSPLLLSLLEHSRKGVTMKPAAQDIQFIKEIYFFIVLQLFLHSQ